jgi:hypothetical protein
MNTSISPVEARLNGNNPALRFAMISSRGGADGIV